MFEKLRKHNEFLKKEVEKLKAYSGKKGREEVLELSNQEKTVNHLNNFLMKDMDQWFEKVFKHLDVFHKFCEKRFVRIPVNMYNTLILFLHEKYCVTLYGYCHTLFLTPEGRLRTRKFISLRSIQQGTDFQSFIDIVIQVWKKYSTITEIFEIFSTNYEKELGDDEIMDVVSRAKELATENPKLKSVLGRVIKWFFQGMSQKTRTSINCDAFTHMFIRCIVIEMTFSDEELKMTFNNAYLSSLIHNLECTSNMNSSEVYVLDMNRNLDSTSPDNPFKINGAKTTVGRVLERLLICALTLIIKLTSRSTRECISKLSGSDQQNNSKFATNLPYGTSSKNKLQKCLASIGDVTSKILKNKRKEFKKLRRGNNENLLVSDEKNIYPEKAEKTY